MNFLQMCQSAARECGVSGSGPTTVVGQTGELGRIVNWVALAHLTDVESAHVDWGWMKRDCSFITVNLQAEYPAETASPGGCGISAGTFGVWIRNRFKNYPTSVGNIGEIEMGYITYDQWRDNYQYGATRYTPTRPMDCGFAPDQTTLIVGPVAASGYTITGQYYRAPLALLVDADTPEYPVPFHMLAVYKAMMYYGAYEAAPEVYNRGEAQFLSMMTRLNVIRMPEVMFA